MVVKVLNGERTRFSFATTLLVNIIFGTKRIDGPYFELDTSKGDTQEVKPFNMFLGDGHLGVRYTGGVFNLTYDVSAFKSHWNGEGFLINPNDV